MEKVLKNCIVRKNLKKGLLASCLSIYSCSALSAVILYDQNFETLNTAFISSAVGYDDLSQQTANTLYGGQPAGFNFFQTFTVETLNITGGNAFGGTGYTDSSGQGGNYTLSMLSDVQNDLLGLTFKVGSFQYLNFSMDFSSIGVTGFNGPSLSPSVSDIPKFSLSLKDGVGLSGTTLDSIIVSGTASEQDVFDWTTALVGLDTTGNTNGDVTLVIDLLEGKYAAMDNFLITSSDTQLDFVQVPEPSIIALFGLGLVGLGFARRRQS